MAGAFDTIKSSLDEYGLGSLAGWAWGRFQEGASMDTIMLEIYQRPEFKATYPEYDQLAQKGRAYSVGELQAYRKAVVGIFRSYGIPETFYDTPAELAQFAANEVSVAEISKRVAAASRAVYSSPPEVRAELERMYNVSPGDMVAFWLDPQKAEPVISQKFLSAEIGAQAIRTGYGMLTQQEAEQLATSGVTAEQAQQGFGELAKAQPLFQPVTAGEQEITAQTQFGAAFGNDVVAQRQIEQRRQQRQAEFQGGGGFAMNREGMAGLTAQ